MTKGMATQKMMLREQQPMYCRYINTEFSGFSPQRTRAARRLTITQTKQQMWLLQARKRMSKVISRFSSFSSAPTTTYRSLNPKPIQNSTIPRQPSRIRKVSHAVRPLSACVQNRLKAQHTELIPLACLSACQKRAAQSARYPFPVSTHSWLHMVQRGMTSMPSVDFQKSLRVVWKSSPMASGQVSQKPTSFILAKLTVQLERGKPTFQKDPLQTKFTSPWFSSCTLVKMGTSQLLRVNIWTGAKRKRLRWGRRLSRQFSTSSKQASGIHVSTSRMVRSACWGSMRSASNFCSRRSAQQLTLEALPCCSKDCSSWTEQSMCRNRPAYFAMSRWAFWALPSSRCSMARLMKYCCLARE